MTPSLPHLDFHKSNVSTSRTPDARRAPGVLIRGCVAAALLFFSALPCLAAETYRLGVYYYPGWSPGIRGPDLPDPWLPIHAFPKREPLLGWYDDARVDVVEQQLQWMHQFGINFVIFDWYWNGTRAAPETAVRAYLEAPSRTLVKYALLWANHFKAEDARKEWDDMVDFWLQSHLKNSEYVQIDGKPVVFIFSPDHLRDNAARAGTSARVLLDAAQAKARAAGLQGIYFVMGTQALEHWVKAFAMDSGFDALSAYNYHSGYAGTAASGTRHSHSFKELDAGYRMQWKWIIENSRIPYFIPIGSGWDRRPWGGSTDPKHDQSVATPAQFEAHLRAAKSMMDAYPQKTQRIGVICCWNEFGEGAYIEPTRQGGFTFLERIRKVFGAPK